MNPIFYLVIKIIIDFKIQFPVKILTFLLIDLIFSKEFQDYTMRFSLDLDTNFRPCQMVGCCVLKS